MQVRTAVEKREVTLRATTANEGHVRVIGLVGNVSRARFRGDKRNFAYQVASPGLIDPVAQLALHALDLALPCFRVGRYFEEGAVTSHGPRMRGEGLPGDGRPRAREPRKRCFRPVEPAHHFS